MIKGITKKLKKKKNQKLHLIVTKMLQYKTSFKMGIKNLDPGVKEDLVLVQ